ncbi:uncharacterized protein LOC133188268 [Saccostrea echinata]|uniref:uncharacterized protein LOC133188268 n=1 Tax=Saccostrea echinata TaxID=191078 RepID=UPI002A7FF162|nr:uncharacterized protein LOC133188268 [Saccostrea echinata]
MDHIPRLSEVLYVGLCRKIGTPTEVAIRRDVTDMYEMIEKPVNIQKGFVRIQSGSSKEGFRLRSSDIDRMFWPCDLKLISDISQSRLFNTSKHIIVVMEDSDTPPGFVRLRLLTPARHIDTIFLVPFDGGAYISSSLWRERYFQFMYEVRPPSEKIRIHGPCTSGFTESIEFDEAHCLATMPWPKQLRNWVDRCQRYTWPPLPVLKIILRNECHCVPIGSKGVSTSNELEWRLSFSLAEQQLVCTMNHTQFLCYGLLKIFLKEVINYRKEPLLCSYYMKTTTFWIMQLRHGRWCPNNLLDCFWRCFKYLLHCVYRGLFHNFFIPENNMFLNKVVGNARESLLQQLYQYYRMGVSCLLLSPTLRSILEPALSNPSFVLSPSEGEFIGIAGLDLCVLIELLKLCFSAQHIWDSYLYLKSINTLYRLSISPHQLLTSQYCTAQTLVHLAFIMANSTSCCTHKNIYNLDRIICGMLKMAARLGPVSYLLYLALYYYRTGRYDKTLHVTYLTKQRLSQTFIIYTYTDEQRYNEAAVGNPSLSRRMRVSWANNVDLIHNIPCIGELCLEQNVSQRNGRYLLSLSPFFMVEMLSVLSHYRLGNRSQCLQSLTDLQTMLLYDNGKYVPLLLRDISWQVLGICQHVVGDLHGALQSYEESLRQEPFNKIKEATDCRIGCVNQQLQKNARM